MPDGKLPYIHLLAASVPNVDNGHKIVRLYTGDFNMDIEHRTATAEKMLCSIYHDIVVPQEKFAELLEASVRIQDMTNQVNLLITNAAAEAVCTGEDNFIIVVDEIRKLVNEFGVQGYIIGETFEKFTRANSLPHSASA
ncbi:hypothetical protein [Treponema sp.]|uniref:hypothetical protein n=1 Tax=Treponema sp. TaxID=166 RepID=UPI003FA24F9C